LVVTTDDVVLSTFMRSHRVFIAFVARKLMFIIDEYSVVHIANEVVYICYAMQ